METKEKGFYISTVQTFLALCLLFKNEAFYIVFLFIGTIRFMKKYVFVGIYNSNTENVIQLTPLFFSLFFHSLIKL